MTRVEKYRRYRNEIANMKFATLSKKKEVSEKVEKIHIEGLTNKLEYEQVMSVYEDYADKEVNFKRKRLIGLTKYEMIYYLIALAIVIGLIVGMIVTGIKLWR